MSDQKTGQPPSPKMIAAARVTGVGVLLVGVALAFLGMGLFMFNMGRDMSTMTKAVTQMGLDVSTMAADMTFMAGRMEVMADSMVEGQAGMSADFNRVRVGMELMATDVRSMSENMNDLAVNIRGWRATSER